MPASRAPQARRLDLTGAVLSVAAFTGLTYTIIEAPGYGWLSATTLGLGAAPVALLAAFVVREARTDHPMLPLHLFWPCSARWALGWPSGRERARRWRWA